MKCYYKSPIGTILVESSEKGISGLYFADNIEDEVDKRSEMTSHWIIQLEEYFPYTRNI
jgi:hypothetical protein